MKDPKGCCSANHEALSKVLDGLTSQIESLRDHAEMLKNEPVEGGDDIRETFGGLSLE